MAFRKSVTKVRALQFSFIAIASVVVFEGIVGLLTNSLAILSDAAHALFDTTTALILLVTTKLSLKPPDEEHLYGHGKIEPIGGLIGGIILIALSAYLIIQAGVRIWFGAEIHHDPIGFWAIGYTLAVDFFRIGTLWGQTETSLTVKASLYHAFSDFASTIIALLGFGLTFIGFDDRADAVASIILGSLLTYLSTRLIYGSGRELSDAIARNIVTEIKREILGIEGVMVCRDLKVRPVGEKIYVETTICVPPSMGLPEAHDIASKIESTILRSHGDSTVTVHIEPEGGGVPMEKQIETLTASVEGVKGVHDMNSVYSMGKLFITLHVMVDPAMSLEKAHTIAEEIEQNLKQQIGEIENVTVHIEPYAPKIRREFLIDDAQVQRMIRQIVLAHPSIRSINRVVIYVSEKRRYINIDCSFDKSVSVEAMHNTVSHIEMEIKRRFKEAVVTIHAEPRKE